jgi:ribose 5-phosphate isomerase RpiB
MHGLYVFVYLRRCLILTGLGLGLAIQASYVKGVLCTRASRFTRLV